MSKLTLRQFDALQLRLFRIAYKTLDPAEHSNNERFALAIAKTSDENTKAAIANNPGIIDEWLRKHYQKKTCKKV